jgi:hypothetical protein
MLVLVHVIIACSSMIASTWALISPSKGKLNATYGLVALTLLSGGYLVWSRHAPMLQTCLAGLSYLGFTAVGIIVGRYRLARQDIDI